MIKTIREKDRKIPIVAMTGYGQEVAQEAIEAGANDILLKPFDMLELKRMIENSGLTVSQVELWPHVMAFDDWIRLGGADEETTETIRAMVMDSMDGDKAGINPEIREGKLFFTWTTAILVAHK